MLGQLAVLLAVLSAWLYLKWRKVSRYWADRGVPYEKPNPIVGNLTFIANEHVGIWFRKLYERFPGAPYVGIWLFWKPALVINSPEIARRILVKDSEVFKNRMFGSGSYNDPIGKYNLFSATGSLWSTMRRGLSPLFTSSKLRALHDLNSSKAKQLSLRIKNEMQKKKNIELRGLFADYSTDLITVAAFGIESNAVMGGSSPMRVVVDELMQFSLMRAIAWISIFFIPEMVKFFDFYVFPKKSVETLRKVHDLVVTERGGYNGEYKHNDMVDLLRKIKYEADQNGGDMPEDALLAQSGTFLQGGFDTSASALSFTALELAHKPDIQKLVYEEVLEAKKKLNGGDFEDSVLIDLPYLNACFKETSRKYIPLGWLDRISSSDYAIDEKLTIPKGTTIYVNAIGMHFDPEYFPDPFGYVPERFLGDNAKNIKPFTFLPFGAGPRNCIGMRFAQRSLRYALANLIYNFEIKPQPGFKKPNDVILDTKGLVLAPGEPMYVDFVPRR